MSQWHFIDENAAFRLDNPHRNSYLYFPLVNEAGLMSSIAPTLHGDVKTGQNAFLMAPVSVEDLHNTRSGRNFWVVVEGQAPWSAAGSSAPQIAQPDAEQVTLEAGFLWQTVTRSNSELGLRAEITNFAPVSDQDQVELMRVILTNTSDHPLTITPTAAIPIYGRSADNLRDHRHVTSLLHRTWVHDYGVLVRPTLSFDERGHRPNSVNYGVLGTEGDGTAPVAFFPVVEEFIGEGGNFDWPQAVVKPDVHAYQPGDTVDGYETMGGLRFAPARLQPGQSREYILILAIMPGAENASELVQRYGSSAQFAAELDRCRADWQVKADALVFHTANPDFDRWMKWITIQPVLRRLFGNSFLPYHDYGRGGRGWRDLWQDCLALLLTEPEAVQGLLFSNYAGVRMDGSNATIIGAHPGEFLADRNNIPRVWMDHGAWPFLTTKLYLDRSGDLAFLLRDQFYFKDMQINRSQAQDRQWTPDQGTQLRTASGPVYTGTILEHTLVQHLTTFFHVGEHNLIKLEGGDWNDGMDMARYRGESVAFTALYASNLRELARMVISLETVGAQTVDLAVELLALLDILSGDPVDYNHIEAKRTRLDAYFASCSHTVSGQKVAVSLRDLARDLSAKADWLYAHLRRQEWITDKAGYSWFNGYYDDDGQRVEGDYWGDVRMTLTGQVFTLMGGIATDEQAREIVRAADHYLLEPSMGGYRLNTDLGGVQLKMGRCFGFAFGHKENGAMFSHMAVMYANALYQRGLVREGYAVLDGLYRHCANFAVSRIYPGIPEYISPTGRGMYTYLTGSASWLLVTLVEEAFGVKGIGGCLALEPKLVNEQFDEAGRASLLTLFGGRRIEVIYLNPAQLDTGEYTVQSVRVDHCSVPVNRVGPVALLSQGLIANLDESSVHQIEVVLG